MDEPTGSAPTPLTAAQGAALRDIARRSIEHGLSTGRALSVDPAGLDPSLAEPRGAFVTVEVGGELHGCIGSIEAHRPLAVEVARSAFAAAFEDPRFEPLTRDDLPRLGLHIAVLSPPRPIVCRDEEDLLAQLRVGIDGVVLEEPALSRRSTFLPAVWEKIDRPRPFIEQLKLKAGLSPDYWSPTLRFSRYSAQAFA